MNVLDIAKPVFRVAGGATRIAGATLNKILNRNPQPKPLTDQTLKGKVESTVFRLPGVSRSQVNITVADGLVTLHGEARNAAAIKSIETAVSAIPEVKGVENLLHQPKTPARSARKPTGTPKRTERVNRDKTPSTPAQPKPADLAAAREGRKPAPLGADESAAPATGDEPAGTAGSPKTPALNTGDGAA